ncbi:MAG: molybdopterin cofactor-binding domain-containing protein, partial [candidate division KSB1 bacterium]|nr:molybdopterin cofactor-binding domain-containing protein [candidate division KSB1 bacterium]
SSGADLNGNATRIACERILDRLVKYALSQLKKTDGKLISIRDGVVCYDDAATELTWEGLIARAYLDRLNLSSHAHYATPNIYFDRAMEKGNAFAYHVCGTALATVTVDCLRGTYSIDAVRIVHDGGDSLNKLIDAGQIEGGLVQGIGWMTMEELMHDDDVNLVSDTFSTYKIPDIHSVPGEINIHFLDSNETNLGVFNSKAIGEPPLMYAIGVYFALCNAIKAFRPDADITYDAPMTHEKVLTALYQFSE